MIRFVTAGAGEPLHGLLIYRESEHSFRFDPAEPAETAQRAGNGGTTSIAIGTLQIEVGVETGYVLFAWGLHSRHRWKPGVLGVPHALPGLVRVAAQDALLAGVTLSVAEVGDWSTVFDPISGWVRVTNGRPQHEAGVTIASGIVLSIADQELCSLWLHPFIESAC